MQTTRRSFLDAAIGMTAVSALWAGSAQQLNADQAHRELAQGNVRFATGHARHPHSSPAWVRKRSRFGQHPHAAVLCCSDSRVAPEILFDQGMGDLFTVRVAGNVVNEDELASMEYAVEHLGVPLCVVLGHSKCGAVTAVVEGEALPPEIEHLLVHIGEAHEQTKQRSPGLTHHDLVEATVRANVAAAVESLRSGPRAFRHRIAQGTLRVEGGVYALGTGHVSWITDRVRR